MQYHPITAHGLAALKQEIVTLTAQRPDKIAALVAARALGDLSENAEYSAAKRDLRHLESRLRYLDKLIRYAQVVPEPTGANAAIGTDVTLVFLAEGETETYHLVGPAEARLNPDNLASDSPLGAAVLNQAPGQVVTVAAPNGEYTVRLTHVTPTKPV
ncbi:transcription elongation factor GreA [Lacticaseibacillus brantae]|uniref:Transcription elongation factor GreA n=1 Tax=Lacticaseibacillus brantae DSM 23927 TaxID=1423727 RepID=A0A0R2AWV6_9LACO|nr:transcription elongation factor GreA [Lacticaseibacillus brantae]KRM71773.1 transcription elongation factor grea [Lacticaseibacillus brantae DSM 23927]